MNACSPEISCDAADRRFVNDAVEHRHAALERTFEGALFHRQCGRNPRLVLPQLRDTPIRAIATTGGYQSGQKSVGIAEQTAVAIALRIRKRSTYPRSVFDGYTPSFSEKRHGACVIGDDIFTNAPLCIVDAAFRDRGSEATMSLKRSVSYIEA